MGKAGLELKKEILLALGKTPMIKDGKLYIEPNAWFVPIKNNYPALEAEYQGLEPTETPINKTQTEASTSVRTRWLRIVNNVRTIIERQTGYIYIPDLREYTNT